LDIPEFYIFKQILNMVNEPLIKYAYLVLFIILLIVSAFIISRKNAVEILQEKPLNGKMCFAMVVLFAWCVISFSQVSTFIYFNF